MIELPSCYGSEERKARKVHMCCECLGTIQPGEKYHYHHGVWCGEATNYKVCSDCESLKAEIDEGVSPDERTPFEGLYESAEAVRRDQPELLARFVETKRRRGASVPKRLENLLETFETKETR